METLLRCSGLPRNSASADGTLRERRRASERCVNDWNERHAPSLMGICADLDSAAGQVTSHARVQEDVSQS
ncbi:MAG: hypothetical protein ACI8RE_003452 [Ilumatobacter sp.]